MSTNLIVYLAVVAASPSAQLPERDAAAPEGTPSAGDAPSADDHSTRSEDRGEQPWIRRWAPERNTVELGVFGGAMFPHPRLELFHPDVDAVDQGFVPLRGVNPELGLRGGYYPLRFLGVEAEAAVMPSRTIDQARAQVWALRGQVVAQLPGWSVTPFVLAGISGLGIRSDPAAVGNDVDLGVHYGGGVKVSVGRRLGLRLDVRDTLSARRGVGRSVAHSAEVLMGLSITLGRHRSRPAVVDSDGDGIVDPRDRCPEVPGVQAYQGCPAPDTDGDGFVDPADRCPEVPGVQAYQGCPVPDTDLDGVLDPADRCLQEPETENDYQDEDGCPDEVPVEAEPFDGLIDGIYFDTGKATIKPESRPLLDEAVDVLRRFPDLRFEITGHADNRGDDAYNLELSRARAEAVKVYLVAAGLDGSRFRTRGAGETEPTADNATETGRAQNRRIEFKRIDR